MTFDINANGIVSVHAKDLITNNEQKIVVNPSSGLTEEEIQRIIETAHVKEEEDRRTVEIQKLRLKLERLLDNNDKAFQEFGTLLDEDKKGQVQEVLRKVRKDLTSESIGRLQEALQSLSDISRSLSDVILYDPNMMGPSAPSI